MATLLLRLAAPMQSWGDESKYDLRHTLSEPTKSGVIGLVAAALGLPRDSDNIRELAEKLRMGVRVDQSGTLMADFHTARSDRTAYVTTRYYLSDACFLVGLESDDSALLNEVSEALRSPRFPLFLGRRACPPTLPVDLGIRKDGLEAALHNEPWLASDWYRRKRAGARLRIVTECEKGQRTVQSAHDQPVSFSPIKRQYAYRALGRVQSVSLGTMQHDPFAEL